MQQFKDINNTRYVISRVFNNNKTTAKLIEERVIDNKKKIQPLTDNSGLMYNNFSGSIQSKEVL